MRSLAMSVKEGRLDTRRTMLDHHWRRGLGLGGFLVVGEESQRSAIPASLYLMARILCRQTMSWNEERGPALAIPSRRRRRSSTLTNFTRVNWSVNFYELQHYIMIKILLLEIPYTQGIHDLNQRFIGAQPRYFLSNLVF